MLQYKKEAGAYDTKLVQKQADIERKRLTHRCMAAAAAATLKDTYPVDKMCTKNGKIHTTPGHKTRRFE